MEPNPNGSLRALKTTALGGVFFLLPIVVVGIVLAYIYRTVATIHEHLEPWIPFHSTTGIASLFCLTIVLLLAACFVAGLVARQAIGRHLSRSIEQQLITVFPKYCTFPDLPASRGGPHEAPDEPADFRAQARGRGKMGIFLLQRLAAELPAAVGVRGAALLLVPRRLTPVA